MNFPIAFLILLSWFLPALGAQPCLPPTSAVRQLAPEFVSGLGAEVDTAFGKTHLTPLSAAVVKSQLSRDEISHLRENSRGVLDVEQYMHLKGLGADGYALGLSRLDEQYQVLSAAKGLEMWPSAYRRLNELQTKGFGTVTRRELDWFFKHPEKMRNVYFVFGGYDLVSNDLRRAFFGHSTDEKKAALAALLKTRTTGNAASAMALDVKRPRAFESGIALEGAPEIDRALSAHRLPTFDDAVVNTEMGASAVKLIEGKSKGAFDLTTFLRSDQGRGGYYLGEEHLAELAVARSKQLVPTAPVRAGSTDQFMNRLVADGKPVVFFVPDNLASGSVSETLKSELMWLIQHPEKLRSVSFVFGADGLLPKSVVPALEKWPAVERDKVVDQYLKHLSGK